MKQDNDELIYLQKLASGDSKAFRYFFMSYYPKLKAFINHFVCSEAVAEDLSQDIFEKIWINRESVLELKSFNAYVYRMAKNRAINYLKHKAVEGDYVLSYTSFLQNISVEEELDAKELELLIQLTVEKMPEQRRRIFTLSRIEGLKNMEIAEKLQLSKRTVESHLNKALKQIREAIALFVALFLS
ncbi:MAG: RNA polymerase sigma-70 factor [Prevotellaceae bacterium]|jgi:RNA polymerase sigma-70 factor (ECF subfamily)|nr:RNA polymerase sigma-70 factor [Prevotellaceae bacterium]